MIISGNAKPRKIQKGLEGPKDIEKKMSLGLDKRKQTCYTKFTLLKETNIKI
jgi:hypothetical protein